MIAGLMEGYCIQRHHRGPFNLREESYKPVARGAFSVGDGGTSSITVQTRRGAMLLGLRGPCTRRRDEVARAMHHGTLVGQPVQMLVDTGCEMTMVSAKLVDSARVDLCRTIPVMCTGNPRVVWL